MKRPTIEDYIYNDIVNGVYIQRVDYLKLDSAWVEYDDWQAEQIKELEELLELGYNEDDYCYTRQYHERVKQALK